VDLVDLAVQEVLVVQVVLAVQEVLVVLVVQEALALQEVLVVLVDLVVQEDLVALEAAAEEAAVDFLTLGITNGVDSLMVTAAAVAVEQEFQEVLVELLTAATGTPTMIMAVTLMDMEMQVLAVLVMQAVLAVILVGVHPMQRIMKVHIKAALEVI
jgi:hypothetical protein